MAYDFHLVEIKMSTPSIFAVFSPDICHGLKFFHWFSFCKFHPPHSEFNIFESIDMKAHQSAIDGIELKILHTILASVHV